MEVLVFIHFRIRTYDVFLTDSVTANPIHSEYLYTVKMAGPKESLYHYQASPKRRSNMQESGGGRRPAFRIVDNYLKE